MWQLDVLLSSGECWSREIVEFLEGWTGEIV